MRVSLHEYFVYILFDDEGMPGYVGRSRYKYRLHNHEKAQGGPALIVASGLNAYMAQKIETNLILLIGRAPEGPLVNKAIDTNRGWHHSEEAKAAIGRGGKGKVIAAEVVNGITKLSSTGSFRSEETKAKMSADRKGKKKKPFTEEHRKNISRAWVKRKAAGL